MIPVLDCSNVQQYFDHSGFIDVQPTKYRGTLSYIEGLCNNNKKFYIKIIEDNLINVVVGAEEKSIKLTEDNYPLASNEGNRS
jgi:hypothetical protein